MIKKTGKSLTGNTVNSILTEVLESGGTGMTHSNIKIN